MSGFDQILLGEWLCKNVAGFKDLRSVEKFSDGQSNPTFKVVAGSGDYVMRAKPPGELLKSAHQVDREYRVMQALAQTNVPVPNMLALCDDEDSPIGRMFFVMEYLEGRIFWDPALAELESTSERSAIYDQMNATLATLHDVNIKTVGLGDFGKPGNYFARQLSRWGEQYKASETQAVPAMDQLIIWLHANMVADDGQVSIVHGDYRIDNMMFAPREPTVIALLDWEISTLGHPYADLAYQCMQWRLPNEGKMRGLAGVDRGAVGIPSEADYVARYCERRGIKTIDNWSFYIAFSFFKLAAILQGVARRALDGNASDPKRGKLLGSYVPLLAAAGMAEIEVGA